jgi:hypothetical protein
VISKVTPIVFSLAKHVYLVLFSSISACYIDFIYFSKIATLGCVYSGAEQMTSGEPLTSINRCEENGELQFVENLRMNVQKLWAELLQLCCTSTCDYCETITAPLIGPDSSQDTKKEVARMNSGPTGSHSQSSTKDSGKTQPFIGICRLTILSCGKHALAELLAEATIITPCTMEGFETKSLKRLLLVTEVMRMVSAQGRGAQVFENWAHSCVTHLSKSNDEQVPANSCSFFKLWTSCILSFLAQVFSNVEHVKTISPPKSNTLNFCTVSYILILRVSTTLTSCSRDGFWSSTNKSLNSSNFCIQNSNITYFGALEPPLNC